MELFEVLDFINRNKKSIILTTLIVGLLGLGSFFILPKKYVATGYFYIERAVENSAGKYFTYEGYYSQQTALAYTNTFIGFLESENTKKNALQKLNVPANEQNMRDLGNQINIKKNAPQIVSLTVKDTSLTAAEKLWKYIADDNLTLVRELNKTGDSSLQIAQIGDPVVKEQFSSIFVNTLAGMLLGFFISVFNSAFKEYRKKEEMK